MKIITERQFDFIPQNKWKILSKKDQDNLRDYRRTYGHYTRNENKITELEKQLKKLNEKKKTYVHRLMKSNRELDHLRNDFRFNWSVSKLKNRPNYYNCYIGRKGRSKSGSLGNPKDINEHLQKYYKRDKSKLDLLEKKGWKFLLGKEMGDTSSKVYNLIIDMISEDNTLNSFRINRNTLFPLVKKKSKPKSKGVSIPIMITNKMRMSLSTLGYSRDEMKHLTPIESHKIINKGVPKKPSVERSRSQ